MRRIHPLTILMLITLLCLLAVLISLACRPQPGPPRIGVEPPVKMECFKGRELAHGSPSPR